MATNDGCELKNNSSRETNNTEQKCSRLQDGSYLPSLVATLFIVVIGIIAAAAGIVRGRAVGGDGI